MRNNDKFDINNFISPDVSNAPVYIWVWNDICNREIIDEQLEEMQKSGYIELQNHSYNLHGQNERLGIQQKKGESKMNLNATVKLLGDETNGISNSTGNPWRGRMVLLEWPNAAGYMNRAWCSLFNSKLEAFETQGIRTGDSVQAEIRFSTRTYRSGFNRTDLEIIEIKKTNI